MTGAEMRLPLERFHLLISINPGCKLPLDRHELDCAPRPCMLDALIGDFAQARFADPGFGQLNIFFRNINTNKFPVETLANDARGARSHKGITDEITLT